MCSAPHATLIRERCAEKVAAVGVALLEELTGCNRYILAILMVWLLIAQIYTIRAATLRGQYYIVKFMEKLREYSSHAARLAGEMRGLARRLRALERRLLRLGAKDPAALRWVFKAVRAEDANKLLFMQSDGGLTSARRFWRVASRHAASE